MNRPLGTFIADVRSESFDDNAIEKMFFNLATVYNITPEEQGKALFEIYKVRKSLAITIEENWEPKLNKHFQKQKLQRLQRRF